MVALTMIKQNQGNNVTYVSEWNRPTFITISWVLPRHANSKFGEYTSCQKLIGKLNLTLKLSLKIGDTSYLSVFNEYHCSYVK